MFLTRRLYVTATLIACCLQAQGADKYTDENRPYEFGFKIDGEQHRHEKKDENGIIMGEFGFITADGVYHVTVYATDENGNFKILSMKNMRVKPYPTAGERKGNSLPFPPSQPGSQPPPPPQSKPDGYQAQPLSPASTTIQKPIGPGPAAPNKTCSGCSIPTTTTRRPLQPPAGIATPGGQFQLPNYNSPAQKYPNQNPIAPTGSNPQYPQGGSVSPSFSGQPAQYPQSGVGGFPGQPAQYPQSGLGGPGQPAPYPQAGAGSPGVSGQTAQYPQAGASGFPGQPAQYPQSVLGGPGQPAQYPQAGAGSPRVSGQPAQYPQTGTGGSAGFPGRPSQLPQGAASPAGGPNYSRQSAQYPQNEAGGSPNYGSQPAPFPAGGVGNPQQFSPQQNIPNTESRFGAPRDRTPKQYEPEYNDVQQPNAPIGPSKPMLISAQMSLVDKNTDIYKRGPGEKEGLPNGLTKNDMTTLLYTFNYTVGFHGHYEEGYTNGAKKGYYYVTSRNGVRTRVDYEADENGFRPKITQEVLDLVSEEVPKPETEKDEKYGLKGYEFKWLYFPTDETKRT